MQRLHCRPPWMLALLLWPGLCGCGADRYEVRLNTLGPGSSGGGLLIYANWSGDGSSGPAAESEQMAEAAPSVGFLLAAAKGRDGESLLLLRASKEWLVLSPDGDGTFTLKARVQGAEPGPEERALAMMWWDGQARGPIARADLDGDSKDDLRLMVLSQGEDFRRHGLIEVAESR